MTVADLADLAAVTDPQALHQLDDDGGWCWGCRLVDGLWVPGDTCRHRQRPQPQPVDRTAPG